MGRGGAPPSTGGAGRQQRRCAATTQRGTPCGAFVPAGRPLCRVHDPAAAESVHAARQRGGARASKLRALQGRRRKLARPGALVDFVSTLIHDTLEGRVEVDVARTCLYGASIQRALIQAGDLEQRLAAVEAALAARRTG